jgi:hypothetical protein
MEGIVMVSQKTQGRVSQASEQARSTIQSAIEQPRHMVEQYPVSSMLLVFGIGLGVGIVISQTLCDPIARAFQPEPTMTERLGRSMYDAMSNVLPESVLRRMSV